MHPVIEIVQPDGAPILVIVQRRLELGREGTDIVLSDGLVSRRHVAVSPAGDGVTVEDLGSSNGTEFNGRPLTAATALSTGDVVTVGDTTLRLAAAPTARGPIDDSRGTVVKRQAAPPGEVTVRAASGAGDVRATSIDLVAREVRDDEDSQHELARLEAKTGGTLTFAFSDIEASTEMAERMGDRSWFEALTAHNTIIEGLVGDHGGKVIKSVGDGFMLTFPGATQASRCAIGIQRAMSEHADAQPERAVRVRIGLHTGEAIVAGGDLFGTHVNMAARVANLATGGQILVSSITKAIAQSSGELSFGKEKGVSLKGLAGTHSVCELHWEPVEDPEPT